MRNIILALVFCIFCALFAVGCSKDEKRYYTVTFIDGDTVFSRVEVERGKRVELPAAPERTDENYIFDGWYFDEDGVKAYDISKERVTGDIVLWSNFLYVSNVPDNITAGRKAFSNSVVWLQRGIDEDTVFEIKLMRGTYIGGGEYDYSSGAVTDGSLTFTSYKNHDGVYELEFTPTVIPAGGVYAVEVSCESGKTVKTELYFKGNGTKANPYLVVDGTDLAAINGLNIGADNYYRIEKDLNVRLLAQDIVGNTFDGYLDGNGKTVTIDAGGCGLFGTLGENAVVEDLTVAGSIADAAENCVGIVASVNNGKVQYCTVSAGIESSIGTAGVLDGDKNGIVGGAGGIVGVNNGSVADSTYSGSARAKVGAGGIAVINNGKIENCTYGGTLGAGNAIESGSSTSAMSYMGGIASVNYGEIISCTATGRLLAQRSRTGGGANNNIGGIVAFNTADGKITKCSTASMRVYGNNNVGGIAGENSGEITYCYTTADYRKNITAHNYIGGTANVGGIVGLTNDGATVSNCYALSNVYAYDGAAYKLAKSATDSIYLSDNLDSRDFTVCTNNEIVNNAAKPLTAPVGDNNIAIEITEAVKEQYKTDDYTLPELSEEQFATLNGESSAFRSAKSPTFTVTTAVKDRTINVVLKIDGQADIDYSVSRASKNKITPEAPDTDTSYVVGYTLLKNGNKIAFAYGEALGYADLAEYGSTVTIYPVYVNGTRPESKVLNVAVFGRFIDGDMVGELLKAFKNSQYFDGYEDARYTVLTEHGVDDYAAAVKAGNAQYGKYNVSFGQNNLDVGQREDVSVSVIRVDNGNVANRQVGIIGNDSVASSFAEFIATDTAKKIMNPNYVEVTLYNGDEKLDTVLVLSNGNLNLTTLEAEEDMEFAGWAKEKEPQDDETLYNLIVSYATLAGIAEEKAVTLYARFTEKSTAPTLPTLKVAVWTRYVDKTTVDTLVTAFENSSFYDAEKYGKSTTVELTAGDNNAFITEYAGAGANMAFAYKSTNLHSSFGSHPSVFIANQNDSKKKYDTLYVGYNGSDEAVAKFAEFLETVEAQKIMCPDYVEVTLYNGDQKIDTALVFSGGSLALDTLEAEEDYKFDGWSVNPEPVEGETFLNTSATYSALANLSTSKALPLYARFSEIGEEPPTAEYKLVVAIHANASEAAKDIYITETEIENLKKAFNQYLTVNQVSLTADQIEWVIVTGKDVSGFTEAVNTHGKVNVAICGNAVNKSLFDTQKAKVDVAESFFASTNRKVGVISGSAENQFALLFYQFMQTGATENE
ncbi:MAG: InlB B-repeat-containing protein [Clostridiales bacterium]|nr:InlB B-repeat-containing protein [Clostridiales bacterium]